MVKKIIYTYKLCVKCKKPLIECNSKYFCDNIKCDRFGLLSVAFVDTKEIKKEVKK